MKLMRAQLPPFLDPVTALDRFNWHKPMAIAELGARSCRTLQIIDDGRVKDGITEIWQTALP